MKATKPGRAQKLIYIISMAALILSIQSCYTIIKSTKHIHKDFAQFPKNSHLDDSLTGVYTIRFLLSDNNFHIRKLEMGEDGSVTYTPNADRSDSRVYHGTYRTINDTLVIKFNLDIMVEWLNYDLSNNALVLKIIPERLGYGSKLSLRLLRLHNHLVQSSPAEHPGYISELVYVYHELLTAEIINTGLWSSAV